MAASSALRVRCVCCAGADERCAAEGPAAAAAKGRRATAQPPRSHAPEPPATARSARERARRWAQLCSVRAHRALAARLRDNSRCHCLMRADDSTPAELAPSPGQERRSDSSPGHDALLGARRPSPTPDAPTRRDRRARRRRLPHPPPRRACSGGAGCSPQPVAPTLVSFHAEAAGRGRARAAARARRP